MAQARSPRDDDRSSNDANDRYNDRYLASKNQRDNDDEWEELDVAGGESAGLEGVARKFKRFRWAKDNPNLVKGIVAGLLLVLMVALFGWLLGWFGGGKSAPAIAVQPPTAPMAQLPSPAPAPSGPGPASTPSGQPGAASPAKAEVKVEQKPPLPDDVAKWKTKDFICARQENDPKLLQAVAYLGEKSQGSESAAQQLIDLLKPLPTEPPPTAGSPPPSPGMPAPGPGAPAPGTPAPASGLGTPAPAPGMSAPGAAAPLAAPPMMSPSGLRPNNQSDSAKLVEAIIVALGDNGSALARNSLEQILAGTLVTDDDKTAVEAALKTLVSHPGKENTSLLLRAILTPEALREINHQGVWAAKDMQAKAFELIKPSASSELRTKLAKAMADHFARLTANDPIREFLLASDPLNCSAQIVFYARADAPKDIKLKLEQQLTSYSATALARLLGVADDAPSGGGGYNPGGGTYGPGVGGVDPAPGGFAPSVAAVSPAAGASDKADADWGPRLAGLLWSKKFRDLIEPPLEELRPLERQANVMLLAATIPQDSTRAALAKLLKKRWNDGPKALETAGLSDRGLTDPGLLVLLKMLPRKDPKAASRTSARGNRPPRPAGAAGNGKSAETAQKKEQAEQDWMAVSSKLVAAWCKRFGAAAAKTADSSKAADGAAPKLPPDFNLGKGAKVIAAYHVHWPDDLPSSMSEQKPSPIEIFYVRAEETNKPKRAVGFYGRQALAKVADAGTIDKATWLDSSRTLPHTDRRRSVDVLITRPDSHTGEIAKDDEEADLIIEVLTIEIKNPFSRD